MADEFYFSLNKEDLENEVVTLQPSKKVSKDEFYIFYLTVSSDVLIRSFDKTIWDLYLNRMKDDETKRVE